MKNPVLPVASRGALLARPGSLAIVRGSLANDPATVPEIFLSILDDGAIVGFHGHVDLGTGVRTALTQIVAEELDVSIADVAMMLGDTEWTPVQGGTAASETIQVYAAPLRCAAAQARAMLVSLAADHFGVDPATLATENGRVIISGEPERGIRFAALVAGRIVAAELDETVSVKPREHYRIVGSATPRVDIPAKTFGESVFVHDLRLPGMVHGRVIRPPYAGRDSGAFVGRSLISVDRASIAHIPGIIDIVVVHDFVGVVAEREEQAEAAARELRIDWGAFGPQPDLNHPEEALRANPRQTRLLIDEGDVEAAVGCAAARLERTYVWPYQMHGSIGPSCSVAGFSEGRLTVWSGTQIQHYLRAELAMLLDMPEDDIDIVRVEASGSYGRNCMDDVGADAALLARATGRTVRVQLSREQEHLWDPKGSAQLMEIDGGIDSHGNPVAFDYATSYPMNISPVMALLLTRKVDPTPSITRFGDRTVVPAYDYRNVRVQVHDMPTIARSSFLRGVSALPTTFAHESYIDELAVEAGVDPVEYRLKNLRDPRAADLIRAVTDKAAWEPRTGARTLAVSGNVVRGQGVAYAKYVHGEWPGTAAAAAAWVAEVEVDRSTGEVAVTRIVVGQDSGMMINPQGVRHQIEGNVIQSTSRVLVEQVTFDSEVVTARDWSTYPILKFPDVPAIDVVILPRPNDPPLGVGESASLPSAAAIANAVYDATGVRFREMPLTPERVLAGLSQNHSAPLLPSNATAIATPPAPLTPRWKTILKMSAALLTAGAILWPLKSAIEPVATPPRDLFSAETIERGRVLAAAGDCAVCHTAIGGATNAGGFAMETPFGVIRSSNITPDPETGIGRWSYAAFERAMRQGVSRDGRHLYPAFPYTFFTRMSDSDLQAIYAWLMVQPPVANRPAESRLAFPFNIRPLLAGWNGLFLKPGAYAADPARSESWNRGAYLVESVGHCAGCHSDRNALGAVRDGTDHLGGGMAEGWEAPALGRLSTAPLPWTKTELFAYLRTGASDLHGPAAGAMQPIIAGLRDLPDSDIAAMADYLAAMTPPVEDENVAMQAAALKRSGRAALRPISGAGARIFDGACAVCHASDTGLFGANLPLALNSNVHSGRPDNLIRVVLNGLSRTGDASRGAMPAFREALDDRQIADLVGYIRRTQAPGKAPFSDLEGQIARIRATTRADAVAAGGHGGAH